TDAGESFPALGGVRARVPHGSAMRLPRIALVASICVAGLGCFATRPSAPDSFVHLAARNGVQLGLHSHDDNHFAHEMKKHAETAFAQRGADVGAASEAFHDGFIEGFIDYVEAGGSGEPPYLPPFHFRLTEYRTPEGHAAIGDWYAGFREGSAAARASGLGELTYVPLPGPAVPADGQVATELPVDVQIVQPFAGDRARSPWEAPGSPVLPRPTVPERGPAPRVVPELP